MDIKEAAKKINNSQEQAYPSLKRTLLVINTCLWQKNKKLYMQLLSHGAECNMENIFRVSHILQLITRAFIRVK